MGAISSCRSCVLLGMGGGRPEKQATRVKSVWRVPMPRGSVFMIVQLAA